MSKTFFLSAIDYEMKNIFDLNEWEETQVKPFDILQNKAKKDFFIIRTGVGKANAAAATQYLLSFAEISRIINVGLVGCINKNLQIGEVRGVNECRFFDVDVTAFGYELGQIPQCEVVNYKLKINSSIPSARLISGDSFITDQKKLEHIIKAYEPDFIDMELGAIAHTLHINDKLEILESYKAPSDYSDSTSKKDYYENEKRAFAHLHEFVKKLI